MGSSIESATGKIAFEGLALNVSLLAGIIHRPPQWRQLPSGSSVTLFDIKVRSDSGRTEMVRVSWLNAPASALDLEEGAHVLVAGRVRSYWSGKRSETDLLATSIVRAKSSSKVRRALADCMATLQTVSP